MEDVKTTYIQCDCGSHVLQVSAYKGENEVYLSMFNYGVNAKMGWWRRIRLAMKFIMRGTVYSDQLVLNYDEASKLVAHVNDIINDGKQE